MDDRRPNHMSRAVSVNDQRRPVFWTALKLPVVLAHTRGRTKHAVDPLRKRNVSEGAWIDMPPGRGDRAVWRDGCSGLATKTDVVLYLSLSRNSTRFPRSLVYILPRSRVFQPFRSVCVPPIQPRYIECAVGPSGSRLKSSERRLRRLVKSLGFGERSPPLTGVDGDDRILSMRSMFSASITGTLHRTPDDINLLRRPKHHRWRLFTAHLRIASPRVHPLRWTKTQAGIPTHRKHHIAGARIRRPRIPHHRDRLPGAPHPHRRVHLSGLTQGAPFTDDWRRRRHQARQGRRERDRDS